jgi:hypothetical protein
MDDAARPIERRPIRFARAKRSLLNDVHVAVRTYEYAAAGTGTAGHTRM